MEEKQPLMSISQSARYSSFDGSTDGYARARRSTQALVNSKRGAFLEDPDKQRTILSGLLLNYCSVYRAFLIDQDNDYLFSLSDIVYTYHYFSETGMISTNVEHSSARSFLDTQDGKQDGKTVWIHIFNPAYIPTVLSKFGFSDVYEELLLDDKFKSEWSSESDLSTFGLSLTSFFCEEDIISGVKLCSVKKDNILITFETRVSAPVDNTVDNISETSNANTYSSPNNDKVLASGEDIFMKHFYVYRKFIKRTRNSMLAQRRYSSSALYLIRDFNRLLGKVSLSAIRVIANHQLLLHDEVFVKFNKPGPHFGGKLRREARVLQSSVDYFKVVHEETVQSLTSAGETFLRHRAMLEAKVNHDICQEFNFAHTCTIALEQELDKIETSLKDSISYRNDRVNLALSIAATIFLPLNFLTGKFC